MNCKHESCLINMLESANEKQTTAINRSKNHAKQPAHRQIMLGTARKNQTNITELK
jgi:hypothetical protein